MIVVTGGAGFIGSNIVKWLNKKGREDILVIDDLSDGTKFRNIVDCNILDYLDKDHFYQLIEKNDPSLTSTSAILHEGACSDTTEWDGKFMMNNNYQYSKVLLQYAVHHQIPFLYASSAAVYGNNQVFKESIECEQPLNVYAYSKWQFDQYVRHVLPRADSQIVGFRYFNVYGPREQHKGKMSSVAFHFNNQIKDSGITKLFAGCDEYGNGEQLRDFIFVDDVCKVNMWFLENPDKSGIFNVGTGRAQSFNDVANSVIAWHGKGKIEYISFPESLKGCYQSYTQADISALRTAGYVEDFHTVEAGVKAYLDILNQ